jgi:phosphoserine phosphatase RsbU/P
MPDIVRQLWGKSGWCHVEHLAVGAAIESDVERFDVVLMAETPGPSTAALAAWEEVLCRQGIGQVRLAREAPIPHREGLVCLPPDAPQERLRGAITALAQQRSALRARVQQLVGLHRLHHSLNHQFDEMDHELQLASRLQRDFLPRGMTKIGPIRISTLYRPCTWVSGDIFDIFPIDERHFGFYLADAIGHGVSAGLLTMYIKHAIQPKRIGPAGVEVVRPSEVMSRLNDQLAAQELPDSQFITGWYGVLDIRTLRLEYAAAGHPPPMIIDGGELVQELYGEGPMLGLAAGQGYSDESIVLQPGQRVLLFSDGLEPALIAERKPRPELSILQPDARQLVSAPSETLIHSLVSQLDAQPGSLAHADDVTMLIFDVE